ncbi:MAG: sugar ABC transporter permease, partial [Thermotogae bacterium]
MSRKRGSKYAAFFLLPALIMLAVFVIYPVGRTAYISFFDENGTFVGLKN